MARELMKLVCSCETLLDSNYQTVDVLAHFKPVVLSEDNFEKNLARRAPRGANAYSTGKPLKHTARDIVGRDSIQTYIPVQYYKIK